MKYGKGVHWDRCFQSLAFFPLSFISSFSWFILPEFKPLQSRQATASMDSAPMPLFVNRPEHLIHIFVFLLTA